MRATWVGTRTLDSRRAPSLSDDHAPPKISPVTTTQVSSPTCRRPPADRPSSSSRHPSPLSPSSDPIRASISGSAARLFFLHASCISLAHLVAPPLLCRAQLRQVFYFDPPHADDTTTATCQFPHSTVDPACCILPSATTESRLTTLHQIFITTSGCG